MKQFSPVLQVLLFRTHKSQRCELVKNKEHQKSTGKVIHNSKCSCHWKMGIILRERRSEYLFGGYTEVGLCKILKKTKNRIKNADNRTQILKSWSDFLIFKKPIRNW